MRQILTPLAILSLLFSGAIFGFFYAWVCSTMWGLDAADPNVAIAAMQAMNASVRNAAFAPAFFGTPLILLVTALVAWRSGEGRAAFLFGAGGLLYLLGALLLTVLVHSPMNDDLALVGRRCRRLALRRSGRTIPPRGRAGTRSAQSSRASPCCSPVWPS